VISEVEKPATGDNGVLVKVHATTVNRTDCAYRAARPFFMRFLTGLIRPRSPVLGTEFAGVVEAVGRGVASFGVGDKVFGYNEGPFGAHAEYMAIPADGSVATMPANVTYQQAAPGTEGAHYALGHIRAAKIRSGQDILVYGASGAIGSKVLFPIPKHDQLMVEHFRKLIESGDFRPVIDRTYPLDQIVEAYRYVEAGQKTGNVVISLEGSR
jgi:NADPH:quinone reductase-like Zn-dependent oxidoreductase